MYRSKSVREFGLGLELAGYYTTSKYSKTEQDMGKGGEERERRRVEKRRLAYTTIERPTVVNDQGTADGYS